MVNEPQKMSNLNTLHLGGMLIVEKKLNEKLGRKFGFPFNLGDFPLKSIELPR